MFSVEESKSSSNNLRRLNEEKESIIYDMDNNQPLIISGPPGVGKSHLAHIFFDKRGFELLGNKEWSQLKEKEERTFILQNHDIPKAHFITLSKKLAIEIKDRIEDYYLGSTKPAEINSWNIHDFLIVLGSKLEVNLEVTLKFKNFCSKLKKFEIQHHHKFSRFSKQSLWKEYENTVITRNGKRRSEEEYKELPEGQRLFNNKNCEIWYKFINQIPREEKTLSEISYIAIRKICDIYMKGTLEERELIRDLESDILVIDEIQDLSVPIIMLLLILHRKTVKNVMIAGDEEQAIAFEGFNWKKIFTGVNAEMNLLDDEFDIEETKKWKYLKQYVGDTKYLINVERNVPPIVDVIKESWNNFDAGLDFIKEELNKEEEMMKKLELRRN